MGWNKGTIYVDEPMNTMRKSEYEVKTLRELGLTWPLKERWCFIRTQHCVFRPTYSRILWIYSDKQYIDEKKYIDTSRIISKEHGERYQLKNLVNCTMNDFKLMDSADAPKLWKAGEYDAVVDYCMKDTKLVYDLWKSHENGIVKGFSIEKGEHLDLEVKW